VTRVNHGPPWGFFDQPAPAPAKNPPRSHGRGFPVPTGEGSLTGVWSSGGFPHAKGCGLIDLIHSI
jgi:hypothetical protein